MAFIEDPKTGRKATVSGSFRQNVSAKSNPRDFYISRDLGKVYNFVSSFDATTGAILISLENDSATDDLYIGGIIGSCLTTCSFDIFFTESGDTPAGTTIAGVNLNATSPNTADVKAFGNAAVTGISNTTTSKALTIKAEPYRDAEYDFGDSLILGRGDGINVALTGNGTVDVTIRCHWEDPTQK